MDLEVFSDPDLLAEHLALIAKAGSSELAGDEDHARNKVRARDKYLRDERARQDFAGLVIRMQKTGVHEKVGYQSAVAFLFDKGHKWPGGGVPSERTLNYYLITARNLPSELVRQCLISIKGYAAAAGVPSELCRTALCQAIEAGATTKSIEGGARAARRVLQKGGSEKRARAAAADEVNREPVTREERTAVAVAQAIRVLDRGRKGEGKAPRPTAEPETSHEIGMLKEGLAGLQQSVEMLVERIQTQGGMPAAQSPAVPEDPRRYPRNDFAEPAPPVVPDAGPAAQTTATPATEMPTEKAARTPVAEPIVEPVPDPVPPTPEPIPDLPEDEEPDEDQEPDEDDHSSSDEKPAPPKPAPQPVPYGPEEEHLAVGYSGEDYRPTEGERRACEVIAALEGAIRLTKPVMQLRYHPLMDDHLDGRLQHHYNQAARPLARLCWEMMPLLADRAREGHDWLQYEFLQSGEDPDAAPPPPRETRIPPHLISWLPVPTTEQVELPMSYLSLRVRSPYHDKEHPEPSPERIQVFRLLALVQAAHVSLLLFKQRNEAGDALGISLAYQLERTLADAGFQLNRLAGAFHKDAEAAREEFEEEWIQQAEEEKMKEAKAQASHIVVGEDHIPGQHTTWGKTDDGRLTSVTQSTPQLIIATGNQGVGKTQGSALIREGCHLPLGGLAFMKEVKRTITYLVDMNKGYARHAPLCGLYPNPYPEQWKVLTDSYGVKFAQYLAAFPRLKVLCMPGAAPRLREQYAQFCERGLEIKEFGFNPLEQNALFYRLMMPMGTEGNGKVRTNARTVMDAIIGNLGLGRTPERVMQEMKKAKIVGEAGYRLQLKLIQDITTPDQFLIDHLEEPVPIIVLLESRDFGPGFMLPLEVAMWAVFCGPLRNGTHPHRWIMVPEVAKQGLHEIVAPFMIENAAEVRHGVVSWYLETQLLGFLPDALIGLATGILHFRAVNQRDYRRVQELFAAFQHLPFRHITELPVGVAFMAFLKVSDPALCNRVIKVCFRPTATWAGGETMRVG